MQFYTIVGAFIIALCGVESAKRLNISAERDIAAADAFLKLLRYARAQIDCYALPVRDIFERCGMEMLSLCGWREDRFPDTFLELYSNCYISDKGVRGIILEFCSDFGQSYREEQLKRCDACISELEGRKSELSFEAPKQKRLNVTLCLGASVAVIILLV